MLNGRGIEYFSASANHPYMSCLGTMVAGEMLKATTQHRPLPSTTTTICRQPATMPAHHQFGNANYAKPSLLSSFLQAA